MTLKKILKKKMVQKKDKPVSKRKGRIDPAFEELEKKNINEDDFEKELDTDLEKDLSALMSDAHEDDETLKEDPLS